mgnify:CR=1 FL=1
MAVVDGMLAGMGRTDGLKPRPTAVTGIEQSLFPQHRQGLIITIVAFLLDIGPVRASHIGTFVQVRPSQERSSIRALV